MSLGTVFIALADIPVAIGANYILNRAVEAAGNQSSSASYKLAGQAAGEETTSERSISTSYKLRSGYHFTVNPSGSGENTYLPLLFKHFISAPDLVVDSVSAGGGTITVEIHNTGNTAVTDNFWVDVYFDPRETPAVNHPWDTIANHGAVWGVTVDIPGRCLLSHGQKQF
ncbi:MAG: hypothetical protein H6631_19000 [Anaerolineaceae bacterium]|nr:hypothetical protein [Anaerolineaceae bacterium]